MRYHASRVYESRWAFMRISQEGRSWSKVGAHAESDTGANAMLTEGSASLPFGKQRPTGNPLSRETLINRRAWDLMGRPGLSGWMVDQWVLSRVNNVLAR